MQGGEASLELLKLGLCKDLPWDTIRSPESAKAAFFSLHFPCPPNLMLISSYNELLGACRLCSLAVFSIFVLQ